MSGWSTRATVHARAEAEDLRRYLIGLASVAYSNVADDVKMRILQTMLESYHHPEQKADQVRDIG